MGQRLASKPRGIWFTWNMTTCTNAALGEALGLSHSTVSRMRTGTRTGSIKTLRKLATITNTPLEDVAKAAESVRAGRPKAWNKILEKACGATDR